MKIWLILPIVIPLTTSVLALLGSRSRRVQRIISLIGAWSLLAAGTWLLEKVHRQGIQVIQMGNWQAPFGISLVADTFSAIMVLLAGVIGLVVAFYSLASIDPAREALGYHPLYHFLLMGVCGAFLAGDLFNLYVWFEVMLIASFVLLSLGGERRQMEGAIKYVTLNLMSSALFLASVGILFGLIGTLNMADVADKLRHLPASQPAGIMTALAMMFLVAFGIKAAIFPLFFWLPDSYHTPPVAVSALFAGLLTKVGVYALIRVFTLIFIHDTSFTHTLILYLAGLTMVSGVLGAVAQQKTRRLLSFHIISQIGYPLMALGLFTPLALSGGVYFIFHVSVAKTALFLVSGLLEHGLGTDHLKKLGGVYRSQPVLGLLFLAPALSLAGLPPLSGFFAKLSLVVAGLESAQYAIVIVALGVSLLTLFSMMKIWNEAFWKPHPSEDDKGLLVSPIGQMVRRVAWMAPIAILSTLTFVIGIGAGWLFSLAQQAGIELMNPEMYIQAVLGR